VSKSSPLANDIASRVASASSTAAALEELGYASAHTKASLKQILALLPRIDNKGLAVLLVTIAKTGDGSLGDVPSQSLADLASAMGLPPPTEAANRAKTWNIEAVADAVRETHPELDWRESVVMHLKDAILSLREKDPESEMFSSGFEVELSPDFESSLQQMNVAAEQGSFPPYFSFFSRLVEMYRRGAGSPFPAQAVVGDGIIWPSELQLTQMKLLSAAVFAVEPSLMEWEFGVTCFPPNGEKSEIKRWSCVDLMLVLTKLAENTSNNTEEVFLKPIAAKVLDRGTSTNADYVVAAISRAENAESSIASDVVEKSLTRIFSNFQNASAPREYALTAAFTHLPDAVIEAMSTSYESNNACIPRIVDAISEMKNLAKVLQKISQLASSYNANSAAKRSGMLMGIEIASLASRREYLNLEKFLRDSLAASGSSSKNNNSTGASGNPDDFARACAAFLRRRCLESEGQSVKGLNVTSETAKLFFECLEGAASISSENKSDIKTIKNSFSQRGSSAGDASATNADGGSPSGGNSGNTTSASGNPGISNGFPADIEAEANAHFQQVYAGQRKINDLVDMLGGFLRSNTPREREVFSCMVHNLFDEYRFFPKYPDKELRITAVLFGQLVQRQLVSNITLGVALRCVLDALRKPFGSKMFAFGSEALEQFKTRLSEWPQYCQHLAQIQHLRQAQPDLGQFIGNVPIVSEPTQVALGIHEPDMGGPEDAHGLAAGVAGMKLSFNDIASAANSAAAAAATAAVASSAAAAATAASESAATSANATTATDMAASVLGIDSSSTKEGKLHSGSSLPSSSKDGGDMSRSGSATAIASAPSGFATSLNLDTLLQASNSATASPDSKTADQIHFAVNNLSGENVKLKGQEVKGKLKPEFYEWFATYMVVKRAAIEPNFHSLYLEMLDEIGEEKLFEEILRATYHNVKVLLTSGKVKTNSGERSLLKNLGSWLGGLTIARLQPVLMIDLDVKGLILDAYEAGRMIAVIPFVAKILEPAKDNFVFKPPNPWTAAILALLAEIYLDRDLKLNLKFETERLFKHFNLSVKDVKPSNLLQNRQRVHIDNPDFVADKVPAGLNGIAPGGMLQTASSDGQLPSLQGQQRGGMGGGWGQQLPQQDMQQQQQQQQRQQNMAAEQPSLSDAQALPNIQAHARVHPQPNVPESVRAMLVRFLPIALTHGIREIVSPVVERSATIACVTSRELVRKDFACDPDTSRLLKAAHAMVSSLAGSLALATSREPLKASASNQLRLLVQRAGASNACEAQALENAIQNAVQDNLELGCSLIEKAATEKAMRDVDEALAPAVVVRRQHKETQQQQPSSISAPFYDSGVALSGKFPAALQLETLRPPRPGSATLMSGVALKVYDDFSRIPRLAPPTPMSGNATSTQSNIVGSSSGGGSGPGGPSGQQPPVPQSAFPGSQPPLPGAPPPPQPPLPGGPPPPSEQSGTTSFLGGGKAGDDSEGGMPGSGVDDSNFTSAQKSAKEMRERVASHFDEWVRVQDLPPGDDRSVMFLQRLERTTFLREDAQEGFLRVLVELAVTHCLGSEKKNQGGEESSMSFAAVDAYCRLVTRLVRRPEESPQQRLALFGRALVAIVRTAMRDTDERGPQFNPKPYFRALSGLLNEMRAPDAVLDSSHPQVLAAFASALLALQPMRVPGFAFAWLELVSHRCFMPRLLLDHARKGRPLLQRLICAALKFLEPYLRECNLTEPVKLLYKGVLRVFLVLLHDFPEFLCDNHVFFLDATPTNCVQLRNLVLSAFPRNMRLPDPFTPNLKIDLLPEISQEPTNATQFVLNDPAFNQSNVKVTIDNYLSSKNTSNASQVAKQVRDDILLPGQKAMQTGTRYDVPMMNALVLYIGVNAIAANQNARNSVLNSSPMELLQKLCDESLDAEGRYYFMSAVANQLRYPNSHTHYFSCITLCLFQETKSELVREQITRVLLERLVVNRPHPWGLLVTFVELIKNPRYNFWAHGFTRCAPEIERLFESVARSCVKSPDEGGEGQQQDGVAI